MRLPGSARPVRYAAELSVDPTKDDFTGAISIDVEVLRQAQVLWLNATELNVTKAEARRGSEKVPLQIVDGGRDFVGLRGPQPFVPGKLQVVLTYSGPVSTRDSRGLFRQREGKDWYLLTHFEAIDARRAFPCFDEPHLKARWQLTLRVPKNTGAFNNSPPEDERDEGEQHVVRFKETLPLPTYLVAFAAGPFERVDAGKVGNTPVVILALKGKSDRTGYAAEATPKILGILEEWFGIPYPYGKMDSIAVPVGGGAMEHPGLVTYGYQLLQARPGEVTPTFKRRSAGVTAHELAHQWFGNLVTTAFWDDIWLNEAFATWMTHKALEKFAPDWPNDESRIGTRARALQSDSLQSARRIRQPIESNDDIANAFDGVTYQKGATVIAMFERWVGPENFRKGVQRYLKAHEHGAANAQQFLAAIAAEAGDKAQGLPAAFQTFLDQAGAPLVTAEVKGDTLQLKQERYRPLGSGQAAQQVWQIPVCARWSAGGKVEHRCTLLKEQTGSLALGAAPEWVLPNDQLAGYYRVDVGAAGHDALFAKADLSPAERAGLLGDAAALARAGRLPYGKALEWASANAKDKSRGVVEAALRIVSPLRDDRLVGDELQPQAARFVRDTFGPLAKELGWKASPDEDDERRLLRPEVLRLVGEVGDDPEILAEARKRTEQWLAGSEAVDADVAGTAVTIAASHGDRALFDKLVKAARSKEERADRTRALAALMRFQQPEFIREALQLTLAEDVDPREASVLFGGGRRGGGDPQRVVAAGVMFHFVKANLHALQRRFARNFAAGLPSLFTPLCDEERAAEVEKTFGDAARKAPGGPRRLQQAMEQMKTCAAFRKAQAPSVAEFLRHRAGASAAR